MKTILKSAAAFIIIISFCFTGIFSSAVSAAQTNAQLDKRYWKLQEPYETAVDAKNHETIIKTGEEIITLFLGSVNPENTQKKADDYLAGNALEINILSSVFLNVADSYETLGDFKGMVRTYKNGFPFIEAYYILNKLDGNFTYTLINNKIKFYDAASSVYAEVSGAGGDTVYHSAKHEPETGVIFGETFYHDNPELRSAGEKNSSAALIYMLFEEKTIEKYKLTLETLAKEKKIVEIAWNLKNEGDSLARVLKERAKIEETAEYLESLGTPVFLRFGAEMNIWTKPADPAKFIEAFRFVAKIVHEKAPNVAMVWSVNSVSAEGKTYEMYYPGDEYADWVGVSLYCTKYFLGNKNQSENAQAIYLTGKYSNPIAQIEPVVKLYGDKKPIMISEGGVENYSITNKTDETDWASAQMRLLYGFLPVVYPQVKAIFYFNAIGVQGAKNRYTLYDNKTINTLYGELISNPYFIKQGRKTGEISYKKLGSVNLPSNAVSLVVYAPYLDRANISKTYRLDTKWIGAGDRQKFDLSSYSDGLHTLTIDIADGGNIIETIKIYVKKNGSTVTLSDKALK